ncbi:hypothetical protein COLO4_10027 [Corchorus olitorius]|uniref:Uncharacterized protein n=1 Tax=Corchorus olitorius TaxID=93759 RepID=A0A1R3KA73_9ROSI|nr:hypothetical protein COLO4_10027 [Corchorus olitorius]
MMTWQHRWLTWLSNLAILLGCQGALLFLLVLLLPCD